MPLTVITAASLAGDFSILFMSVLWLRALQTRVPRTQSSRVSECDRLGPKLLGRIGLAWPGPIAAYIGVAFTLLIGAVIAVAVIA